MDQIAHLMSAEELMVRNETFEEFHWQRLEDLYRPYNDYFKDKLGFDVDEAIDFAIAICEYSEEKMKNTILDSKRHAKQMYDEVMAYKHRNKPTINPYPPDYLERFKTTPDKYLKFEFETSMMVYSMTTLGHFMSFKIEDIVALGNIDQAAFKKFLDSFSITFGEIKADFSMPEVMHPLKDRPILRHEDTYFCSSTSLLDYSLDRRFAKELFSDSKKREKYKLHRHDYLLREAMQMLTDTLKTDNFYENLLYPGGELDGLIFCGNNALFIEAKGHQVSDRAKKGYFDRIKNHVDDVVADSYKQAIRTYNYLKGNANAEFQYKNGKKLTIDGTSFKQAYFISLSLESLKAVSTSLKVGNSLGLFDRETFPWIVNLYDLKVVCEHMEGPAYLIQYMHRRKEFFSLKRFMVDDELDLLYLYLDQNLRFDELLKKHQNFSILKLAGKRGYFDEYYAYKQGLINKKIAIKKHYTQAPIKALVTELENCGLPNAIDAAVLLLEFSYKTKNSLLNNITTARKKFKTDNKNHDLRLIGHDQTDNSKWMFSYWVGPNTDEMLNYFQDVVTVQFNTSDADSFYAIFDHGKSKTEIVKVLHFRKDQKTDQPEP